MGFAPLDPHRIRRVVAKRDEQRLLSRLYGPQQLLNRRSADRHHGVLALNLDDPFEAQLVPVSEDVDPAIALMRRDAGVVAHAAQELGDEMLELAIAHAALEPLDDKIVDAFLRLNCGIKRYYRV